MEEEPILTDVIADTIVETIAEAPAQPEQSLVEQGVLWVMDKIGLAADSPAVVKSLTVAATLIIAGLIGWVAYMIAKRLLPKIIGKLTARSKWEWDDMLFDQKFFNRLGALIVPIVLTVAISSIGWDKLKLVLQLLAAWTTLSAVSLVSSFFDGIVRVYENCSTTKEHPVRVFKQVLMIFLWIASAMVILSIFTEKSPWGLLGGITAFAAVIMLVFQDSILGFVAGIQLGSNHMVRVGDWIEMPSRRADGDVVEIGLTTVKVQNWDKTITTIPTHKLVSESFTNWRGMQESGGRRIKRSVNIDTNSIHYLSDEELASLKSSALLSNYIDTKIAEITEYNANRASHLDARRLTNIGTFREYLEMWLANNPNINQEMTHMVRQLQPGPTGLPLEVYCFSANKAWIDYENIQSDVFDHIYAVMPLFGLRAFQYSGNVVA